LPFSVSPIPAGKGDAVAAAIEIENIDELRQREGIDDVELHEDIGRLQVGDQVRLTFLYGPTIRETLLVRITRIRAGQFRGRVVGSVARLEQLGLRPEALVTFAAGQIHSIARPQSATARGKSKQ
jgi:hypothetical protein